MLRLRHLARLGAWTVECWQARASLSALHLGSTHQDEEGPEGAKSSSTTFNRLRSAWQQPSFSGSPHVPFGLSALDLSGGGRTYASSPQTGELLSELPANDTAADFIFTDVPANEAAEAAAAAVSSGVGSEVAAIADQSIAPIAAIQYALEAMHQYTGLPWWATIAATTLTARLCLAPITIYQMKATARMSAIRPEMEKLSNKLKAQLASNPSDKQSAEAYQQQLQALMKKNNVNPFSMMAGAFAQAPLFVGFFLAIRRMSENLPSFKEGGIFWFTDLSGADPTYLLPTLCAATFLVTVEVGAMEGMQGQPMAGKMKTAMRLLGVAMIPLTMSFEKALFCYWIPSNIFSLMQAGVLKFPGVKAALGIPNLKATNQSPVATSSVLASNPLTSATEVASLRTQTQTPLRPNKKRRSKRR